MRHLPRRFGRRPLYVTPDAALSWLKPGEFAFDAELLRAVTLLVRPGDTVWDIGANVGAFALGAAHVAGAAGQVLAVEPDTWLAQLVRDSAQLPQNADLSVSVLAAAVSDRVGIARFHIAARGRASSSLASDGRSPAGGVREVQLVPVLTLDDLLEAGDAPDCLKIDVEGGETRLLQGGSQLLSEFRPRIYCEVGDDQTDAVTAILRAHDYRLWRADGDRLVPTDRCVFNTFATPAD